MNITQRPQFTTRRSDLYITLKKRRLQRAHSRPHMNLETYVTLALCAAAVAYYIIRLAI